MTNEDIRKLLAAAYELEGLLLLAEQRGKETPLSLVETIKEKISDIALMASPTISQETVQTKPETESDKAEQESAEYEVAEAPNTSESEAPEEVEFYAPDNTYTADTSHEEPEVFEEAEEPAGDIADNETYSLEETAIPEAEDKASKDEVAEDKQSNDDDKSLTMDEVFIRNKSKDLRNAFSINDKFRFRRELFGNNATEMNDAINLVDAMKSYAEAEDYFYNDLGWNPEAEEVNEFMTIIRNHFL